MSMLNLFNHRNNHMPTITIFLLRMTICLWSTVMMIAMTHWPGVSMACAPGVLGSDPNFPETLWNEKGWHACFWKTLNTFVLTPESPISWTFFFKKKELKALQIIVLHDQTLGINSCIKKNKKNIQKKKNRNGPDFISYVHVDNVGSIIFNFHSIDNTDDFRSEITLARTEKCVYVCFIFNAKVSELCD